MTEQQTGGLIFIALSLIIPWVFLWNYIAKKIESKYHIDGFYIYFPSCIMLPLFLTGLYLFFK